ncbi:MAG: glycoside hydrolase family 3 C-terminal domain-containing protein [Spirochaetaceae bacterium]|jgi:beta-glucosidase|nr:glycoside hydrolase family 3 C-terminal domain-containing protein [Spirochaetaceae bacterium]
MADREERIRALIAEMSLEEKVSQLSWTSPAVERLGIPEYNWWNEALHGVARAGLATVFPQAIGLGAAFDEGLAREVADAIADEARAKYNEAVKRGNRGQYYGLTFWTPNINIFRDPRWGRGQETYGEDPYLTGRIGLAFMKGLQGDDGEHLKTAACAKHYAVHSGPEKLRHVFDAVVSPKDLWETYLPAFKVLVDNGVEAVMGAYNRTLGEPCCGSTFLLEDVLRGKWGFSGHVVSDCWAIRDFHENHKVTESPEESAALALNAGCDLNCGCTYPMLTVARKKGLVSEEAIDRALTRLLRTRFKLGILGEQAGPEKPGSGKWDNLGREVINCEKHRKLALKAAEKSIVLLKNSGGLLPLDDSAKKILVLGPSAANAHVMLGNYHGMSVRIVTLLEGLTGKMRDRFAIQIEYRLGCLPYQPNDPSNRFVGEMVGGGKYDVVIACFGLDSAIEGEEGDTIASTSNGDRDTIELPPWQLAYLRNLRQSAKKVILVLTSGSPVAVPPDLADSILYSWYPGERGGEAVANIIFGDAVPSGKLPITVPEKTEDLPPYEDYAMKGRTYRYMEKKPLYPFGFGLSYTTFRFDNITLSGGTIMRGGTVKAVVRVTNTGTIDAEEVVQVYISKDKREADDPAASLRAFKRAAIAAGKQASIEFTLNAADFESVNQAGESALVPGVYTVTAADAAPLPVSVERGAAEPVSAKITAVNDE